MASFPLNTKYIAMKKLNAKAITTDVETPDEISEKFDRISYQKVQRENNWYETKRSICYQTINNGRQAATVINMLESAMGKSKFVNGIKDYLESYRFRNAESRDLFETLRHDWHCQVHGPMDEAARISARQRPARRHDLQIIAREIRGWLATREAQVYVRSNTRKDQTFVLPSTRILQIDRLTGKSGSFL